jgi:hypothetical protein
MRLQTGGSGRAWDWEQARIYKTHNKVRPVKLVDGALILEWREVAVVAGIETEGSTPPEVVIEIASRPKPATPEQVAKAYEETLNAQGVRCDVETEGAVRFLESMHHLYLTLKPVERPFPPDEGSVSLSGSAASRRNLQRIAARRIGQTLEYQKEGTWLRAGQPRSRDRGLFPADLWRHKQPQRDPQDTKQTCARGDLEGRFTRGRN